MVYKKYDITQLKGQKLRGLTSGVVGVIVDATIASETESDVVFINYTNSEILEMKIHSVREKH